MRAACPAAGAAHAAGKFGNGFLNANAAGFCFFPGDYPTNPIVFGEGRGFVPSGFGARRL